MFVLNPDRDDLEAFTKSGINRITLPREGITR